MMDLYKRKCSMTASSWSTYAQNYGVHTSFRQEYYVHDMICDNAVFYPMYNVDTVCCGCAKINKEYRHQRNNCFHKSALSASVAKVLCHTWQQYYHYVECGMLTILPLLLLVVTNTGVFKVY